MVIAVDFDGTCVTHEYPKVGRDVGAVPILRALAEKGHKLILFTMRHNDGLTDAEAWFSENNIPLYGVNDNPSQKGWTDSRKVYAKLYIDDAALGVPLRYPHNARPYVDWFKVRDYLLAKDIL